VHRIAIYLNKINKFDVKRAFKLMNFADLRPERLEKRSAQRFDFAGVRPPSVVTNGLNFSFYFFLKRKR
jgi:hypothetical protein